MRRRKRLVVLAGLVLLLAAGAAVLWPRPNRITPKAARQIQEGMVLSDVEAILGPPGDYSTKPDANPVVRYWAYTDDFNDARWNEVRSAPGITVYEWTTDEFIVDVYCRSGRVVGVDCSTYDTAQQTLPENLLWRARRQWRKWFP